MQPNTDNLPQLLYTKEQAAAILNIPESSIDYLLRKATIPRHKIANKVRFTMTDLESIVSQAEVTSD